MVNGKETLFENIYEAKKQILASEKVSLENDIRRKEPLVTFSPFSGQIIQSDSLDYSPTDIYNNASEDKFVVKRLTSGRYALSPNLKNRYFLFRGESSFHPESRPTLFRDSSKTYYLDSNIHGDEMRLLILSHPLVQLLDLGVEIGGRFIRFEMNLYGLLQHYYNKSSLVDLTSDIDVALFFATQKYDSLTDTYTPITDENQAPGVLYYYVFDKFMDFSTNEHRMSCAGLQVFPRTGVQKGFFYCLEKYENFNSLPRLHAFRFKHNARIAQEISDKMERGKKLFPDDILMKHWRNANRKTDVVSQSAVRLNLISNPKETYDGIVEKLDRQYNVKVDDYKPQLSKEELHEYYEGVKHDGLWEQFCNQIFIPGDHNKTMWNDLLNLPNDPRYAWAFKEGLDYRIDYDQGFLLERYKDVLL